MNEIPPPTSSDVTEEPQPVPCAFDPQEQTRLRCTECETPICPKCMVMYEVGFKCPNCAKKRPSHLAQTLPSHGWITAILSIISGFGYGWLHPFVMGIGVLRIFGIPILAYFLAYGLGRLVGNLIHRAVGYKMSPTLSGLLAAGVSAGLLLSSPFSVRVLTLVSVLMSAVVGGDPMRAGTSPVFYLWNIGLDLVGGVFFIRGALQSFRSWR